MNATPHSPTAPSLLHRSLATEQDLAPTLARVTLGLVMLPHGAQKLLGLFGGYGFSGTMNYFTDTMGLPWLLAFLVIAAESFGALMLIVGAGARFAAAGVALVMLGAIATTHLTHGFFMNWFGSQAGEGFEFHLLALGLAAIVFIRGAGRFSADATLTQRR